MANKKDVSFFTPENELQKKTGIGGLPESVIQILMLIAIMLSVPT